MESIVRGHDLGTVIALHDTTTVTDLALAAYERALEPKQLVTLSGGHFDAYVKEFDAVSAAAIGWIEKHLGGKSEPAIP